VTGGMISHVMTFEVGAVLDDAHWQAPVYCANKYHVFIKVSIFYKFVLTYLSSLYVISSF
jgi:hypothetical protein